jgi:cysteine desulfurase/selenocysteine lyase
LIYEQARKVVQQQIGALHTHEIIFTSGTTASINMAASILSERFLQKDDVVMVTEMEHHSNLLPWMNVCKKKGCVLKVIPVLDSGLLNLDWFAEEISKGVKILSFTHISNTLGVENPVKEMIAMAKKHGVIVVVDGAQAICHLNIDVVDLDADFYCFGAHKVYGPTGIGVMYAKEEYLRICEPWQWGGGIISKVSFDEVVLADLPFKYEAGTPNMEGAVGLSAALPAHRDFIFSPPVSPAAKTLPGSPPARSPSPFFPSSRFLTHMIEAPNKADAGNGSEAVCRVGNVLPPPAGGALRVVFDKLCRSAPLTLAVA